MKATNTSENQTDIPNAKCSMLDDRCSMIPIPNSVSSAKLRVFRAKTLRHFNISNTEI